MQLRRFLWLIVALVVLLVGLVVGAPTILSSNPGRNFLVRVINGRISGNLEIRSLSFAWFSGQSAEGIKLKGRYNEGVLDIERFSTEASLWKLVTGNYDLGHTEVVHFNGRLIADAAGVTNLEQSLEPPQKPRREAPGPPPGRPPLERPEAIRVPFPLAGDLELKDATVRLEAPGIDPVFVRKMNGMVQADSIDQPITFSLAALAEQAKLSGELDLKGTFGGFEPDGTLRLDRVLLNLDAAATGLPVDGIDQLFKMRGLLSTALGSRLDLVAEAKAEAGEAQGGLVLTAPNLSVEFSARLKDGELALTKPGKAAGTVSRALFQKLLDEAGAESEVRLAKAVPITLTIDRLTVPIDAFRPEIISLRTTLSLGDGGLAGDPLIGDYAWQGVRAVIDAPSIANRIVLDLEGATTHDAERGRFRVDAALNHLFCGTGGLQLDKVQADVTVELEGVPTGLIDRALGQDGLLIDALGPRLDLTATSKSSGAESLAARLIVRSSRLKAEVPLTVTERIALEAPAKIQYTVSPSLVKRLLETDQIRLKKETPATLTISHLSTPRPTPDAAPFQPDLTEVDATLSFGDVIVTTSQVGEAALRRTKVRIKGDTLSALALSGESILEQADPKGVMRAVLGPSLSLTLEATGGVTQKGPPLVRTMALSAVSETLEELSVRGELVGEFPERAAATLNQPATLRLRLTPEGFAAILRNARQKDAAASASSPRGVTSLALSEPANIKATVKTFRWPLDLSREEKGPTFAGVSIDADASVARLALKSTRTEVFANISQLQSSVTSNDLTREVRVALRGEIEGPREGKRPGPGKLAIEGKLTNLFTADGKFNTEGLSARLRSDLAALPVQLLDDALGTEERLLAVLGEHLNVTTDADLEQVRGPVTVELNATNSRARLAGALGEGILALSEPLHGEVTVTPRFGRVILKDVNPLLVTAVSAEKPITVEVDQEGFEVPIFDFVLKDIRIQRADIELGTIVLENGGVLRALMGLLKRDAPERVTARVTPIVAHIEKGLATYERMDLTLSDGIHIASWGKIDLLKDRLDMILGLTARTLDNVFGIEGLPADYVLPIPLSGRTGRPEIDWGKAASHIAGLVARKKLEQKIPGVGGLIEGILGGDTPAPVPKAPEQVGRELGERGEVDQGQKTREPVEKGKPSIGEGLMRELLRQIPPRQE